MKWSTVARRWRRLTVATNIDAPAGAQAAVAWIIDQIRARWPRVEIVLRADSGFAREELMAWGETNRVDYVFGLARNERLIGAIADEPAAAEAESLAQGGPARRCAAVFWATRASWSRERRVIAKAEHLAEGAHPRFVVTSLPARAIDARTPYEDVSCARGDMENWIKEQLGRRNGVGAPFPNLATKRPVRRPHRHHAHARQPAPSVVRLVTCVLLQALRRIGLRHAQLATATGGTIGLKLLQIGAQMRKSVRRIKVAVASAGPCRTERHLAYLYLRRAAF